MRLVKVITELRFSGRLKLLKLHEELHLAILGEEPKQPERWLTPSLVVDAKQRKMRATLEPKRCAVGLEEVPNTGYCVRTISQIFKKVDNILEIPLLDRAGVKSMWIESFEGTFADLLAVYKKGMLGGNILSERASDVGAVLDFVDEDCKVSLTTGPMEAQQLKTQFLTFEAQSIPDVFMFIAVDRATTSQTKYSNKFLTEFIRQSLDCGEERAKTVVSILRSKP
jgi:hypothetical protein